MKNESQLKSVVIICACEKEINLDPNLISFYATNVECETCGNHGDISFRYSCPECKKDHEIQVKSW